VYFYCFGSVERERERGSIALFWVKGGGGGGVDIVGSGGGG